MPPITRGQKLLAEAKENLENETGKRKRSPTKKQRSQSPKKKAVKKLSTKKSTKSNIDTKKTFVLKDKKSEQKKKEKRSLSPVRSKSPAKTVKKNTSIILPSITPTKEATEHLNKELQRILKSDCNKHGFSVQPVEENIFKWKVYLFGFDKKSQIDKDLKQFSETTGKNPRVKLEVIFPQNYPSGPPFIRVVRPRFHQYTGHITIGGSLCIQDLTTSGWKKNNELESFFIMLRNLLLEGGALVNLEMLHDYSEFEARAAFKRVASQHGWM